MEEDFKESDISVSFTRNASNDKTKESAQLVMDSSFDEVKKKSSNRLFNNSNSTSGKKKPSNKRSSAEETTFGSSGGIMLQKPIQATEPKPSKVVLDDTIDQLPFKRYHIFTFANPRSGDGLAARFLTDFPAKNHKNIYFAENRQTVEC